MWAVGERDQLTLIFNTTPVFTDFVKHLFYFIHDYDQAKLFPKIQFGKNFNAVFTSEMVAVISRLRTNIGVFPGFVKFHRGRTAD
jgi:hypothetical protein